MKSSEETTEEHNELVTCPHCGNKTTHNVVKKVNTSETIEIWPGEKYDRDGVFALAQCTTCTGISLYYVWVDDIDPSEEKNHLETVGQLLYPSHPKLGSIVPEKVRRSYEEAKKVERISSYGFAVLIRKTLEQIYVDKKAQGDDLKKKIQDLAKQDIIPGNLAKMAQALRLLGNLGAHSSDYEFDEQETNAIGEFIIAVIEYVYVAPHKVQKLAESIEKKKV